MSGSIPRSEVAQREYINHLPRDEAKLRVFLMIAERLGMLSTCDRAAVGAVITRQGRCVAWGFNGAPPGLPHCDENHHGWLETNWPVPGGHPPDPWMKRMLREQGCRNATHAEANALAFAARQGISTEGGVLYVSLAPCLECARLLIAAGIVGVVAGRSYREAAGVTLLRQAGVTVAIADDRGAPE